MTPSDITAIVAIVISAIVSIVATITSYKTNKENIAAKRSEITLEKRLDSFQKIIKSISRMTNVVRGVTSIDPKDRTSQLNYLSDPNHLPSDFSARYEQERIFFPKHIANEIDGYMDLLIEFGKEVVAIENKPDKTLDFVNIRKLGHDLKIKEEKIIGQIQEFIGIY